MRSWFYVALEGVIVASTAAGLALPWLARKETPASPRRWARLAFHPLTQFVLVLALLASNQVLFNAWVLRALGGSTASFRHYFPQGWFVLATGSGAVRFVAAHVGSGIWLAPTLLRVQAFLELPFVLFAYLAVARMLGRDAYAPLVRPVALLLASLAFSWTFGLVEVWLENPWTRDDLWLRCASCLLTPAYVAFTHRRAGDPSEGPTGLLGMLAFVAGAGAVAFLVLAAYDTFLLYNLGHAGRYAMGAALALGVAAVAAVGAARADGLTSAPPAPSIQLVRTLLAAFTVVFFVPCLTLRYAANHETAWAAAGVIVLTAAVSGSVRFARTRALTASDVVRLGLGAALGLGIGVVLARGLVARPAVIKELLLARAAMGMLVGAIVPFWAVDALGRRAIGASPRTP